MRKKKQGMVGDSPTPTFCALLVGPAGPALASGANRYACAFELGFIKSVVLSVLLFG